MVRVTFLLQFLSALGYLFIRDFAAFVVVATWSGPESGSAEPEAVEAIVEPALLRLTESTNYR